MRHINFIDDFVIECDKTIKTLFGKPETSNREVPGDTLSEPEPVSYTHLTLPTILLV